MRPHTRSSWNELISIKDKDKTTIHHAPFDLPTRDLDYSISIVFSCVLLFIFTVININSVTKGY